MTYQFLKSTLVQKLLAVLFVSQVVFGFGMHTANAQSLFAPEFSQEAASTTTDYTPTSTELSSQVTKAQSTSVDLIKLIIPIPVCNDELKASGSITCNAQGWTTAVKDIGAMVNIYTQLVIIAGIVMTVFISILSGFQVLMSATNFIEAKNVKSRLKNSSAALIILIFSYVILQQIDPRLTSLQFENITQIEKVGCCQVAGGETYYWMNQVVDAAKKVSYTCTVGDTVVAENFCTEAIEGDVEIGTSQTPGTVSPNVVGDKNQLIQTILNAPITFQVVAKKESLEKMNLNALKSIIQSHLILPGRIKLNALAEPSESHKTGPHADGRGVDIDSPSLTLQEIETLYNGMKNSSTITQFLYCRPYDRGDITCGTKVGGTVKCSTAYLKGGWVTGGISEERRALLCKHRTHIHYTATK